MSLSQTNLFYAQLPVNALPVSALLVGEHLFTAVPADWYIVITDVRKSTAAVAGGQHETVNLIATGCIVAVLNIAHQRGISVPYFFGGDGATFLVPPVILEEVLYALVLHQENSEKNLKLYLRVGQVPVAYVYEKGQTLIISKLKATENYTIPVVLGQGLNMAEAIIKGEDYLLSKSGAKALLNLSGMQCRWDKIRPPAKYDEVVSLIILAAAEQNQAAVFKKAIDAIEQIYGAPAVRNPISVPALRLKGSFKNIGREIKVKLGRANLLMQIVTWFKTALGPLYFKSGHGRAYLNSLVEMADTLVIDGKINTVISGTSAQRRQLEEALQVLEAAGFLHYGLHVSRESVMSCYVRDMNHQHVHFVDGSEGGYTRAAGVLKGKRAGR